VDGAKLGIPTAYKPFAIATLSMYPTIAANDRVLANLMAYRHGRTPQRGEIIMFTPTPSAESICPAAGRAFIKRVVGIPGDTVQTRSDHRTYVNGAADSTPGPSESDYTKQWPRVPAGQLLVLGDNRAASCDSHQWPDPFVPFASVIGRVEAIYAPPEDATLLVK
jgi:signal peptidase I